MEKQYIAKPDSWFKTGTEVNLIEYMHNKYGEKFCNFEGIYVIQNSLYDNYWRKRT